jgi:hypothetical protein
LSPLGRVAVMPIPRKQRGSVGTGFLRGKAFRYQIGSQIAGLLRVAGSREC